MTQKNERLFDVRLVERNINKGLITREEYEQHLKDLADRVEESDKIEAEFVENVLDGGKE